MEYRVKGLKEQQNSRYLIDLVTQLDYNMTTNLLGGKAVMSPNISIRPSKDIRTNYAQISALTRQNPVAITVNGKEDTVLLSHDDFQDQLHYISELEARVSMYAHLAQAMDDIKLGRVQSADAAFADILVELENLEI